MEPAIAISKYGPECPRCHNDGFEDWWHGKTCKAGIYPVRLRARCSLFFSVTQYTDGETHSSIKL